MNINVWVGLSSTAHEQLRDYLTADDDTIPANRIRAVRIFRKMQDRATVQRLFRRATVQGREYRLYSLTFDLDREGAQSARDAFDYLETEYPSHFNVVGAWHFDGRQVGTQWVDEVGGEVTGTPMYPLPPLGVMLRFMPTIKTYDEDGNLTGEVEPTELTDVNLLQGQSPRRFA